MRMPRLWSVLPALLSLWLVAGCAATIAESPIAGDVAPSAADAPGQVRVTVTVDFGAVTILAESVAFHEGMTALQALQAVADVGTTYGGGFVQSIEGVGESRESRTDWFYSVNGVLAKGGSAGLELRKGDITHWDYRRWDFRRNVSATLGCFPAFLRNGYRGEVRPTVVAYGQEFQDEALDIVAVLASTGVSDVRAQPLADVDETTKQDANLIVVAGSDEPLVREVFVEWEKLGLFARLDAAGLEVFTSTGDATWVDGSAGLLQPLLNPWNPSGTGACENITLLVTGTDAAGVRAAVSALMDGRQRSETWCGAMVGEAGVTPLPAPAA
jgi:hypothetical protein